jgi:hypothetical protein
MSTAYIPWITPQNYQSIKRIMRTHSDFPDTYDEWVYLTNKKIAEITASGNIAEKTIIDPGEFTRFCEHINCDRDITALGNFALAKGSGQPI